MNYLQSLEAMYKSAGVKYTTVKKDSITALDSVLPRGAGRVVVAFANDGKDFFDSAFVPAGKLLGSAFTKRLPRSYGVTKGQDIENLFEMVVNSPFKNGDYFYGETEDGEFCALIWLPKGSDLATFFVCATENGKFLGVIGADIS